MTNIKSKNGILLGIFSGILWATYGIAYESLYKFFNEINTLSVNILILFLIDLAVLINLYIFIPPNTGKEYNKDKLLMAFSGLIGGPLAMFVYIDSIQEIGSNYTSIISISYPILVAILSKLMLKQKVEKKIFAHITIITISMICILMSKENNQIITIKFLLPLLCAFCWASEIILSSYKMMKYNASIVYFYRQIGSSTGYLIILIYQISKNRLLENIENNIQIIKDPIFISLILIMTISSGLSYFLYYKSIEIIKPVKAVMLNITYSVWIIFINSIIYKEESKISLLLTLLILINIFLIIRRNQE